MISEREREEKERLESFLTMIVMIMSIGYVPLTPEHQQDEKSLIGNDMAEPYSERSEHQATGMRVCVQILDARPSLIYGKLQCCEHAVAISKHARVRLRTCPLRVGLNEIGVICSRVGAAQFEHSGRLIGGL